jgi:hypothetical protein
MRTIVLAGLAVAAVVMAGCSTATHVGGGPIKATTFSYLKAGPLPEAAFTENRQHVHALIQEAITKDLAAKGVGLVAAGGDVTVAYLLVVGNNATTTSINDYFGYTADATALVDKAHKAYTGGEQRAYFEAGTLLIDIVNPRTNKVLARNYVTRPILRDATDDVRKARIEEAVNEALKGVRFEH